MILEAKRIVVHPTKQLRQRIDAYCESSGVSVSEMTRRAIDSWLRDRESEDDGNRDSHDQGRRKASRA